MVLPTSLRRGDVAQHMNLRAARQSLAARGIRLDRDGSYPDGRCRFAVWRTGTPRFLGRTTDDVDMAYIMGLRMAPKEARYAH